MTEQQAITILGRALQELKSGHWAHSEGAYRELEYGQMIIVKNDYSESILVRSASMDEFKGMVYIDNKLCTGLGVAKTAIFLRGLVGETLSGLRNECLFSFGELEKVTVCPREVYDSGLMDCIFELKFLH